MAGSGTGIAPPTVIAVDGIFTFDTSGDAIVVLGRDPAPGAGSGRHLDFGSASINDSGAVAFQADLSGGTAGSGVFSATPVPEAFSVPALAPLPLAGVTIGLAILLVLRGSLWPRSHDG